jgi:hypothetical protein
MTTADPASGLERLNALITPDLWEQVAGENLAAVVGWGMMFNVAYLVRGVRTLHAASQCFAARPLLRSVMEYAMGTIWLADAGQDAVDVLNRRLLGAHVKLLADFGEPRNFSWPGTARSASPSSRSTAKWRRAG